MNDTKNQNHKSWQFNRQVNVSVLIQLVFLASLIVGSWVNLQRQLDLLQRDVTMLLQCQKDFTQKLDTLSAKSISYELGGYEEVILEPMQKKYKYVCEGNVELYNELAEQKTEIEQFKTLQQDHRRLTGEAINLRLERRKLRAELDRLKKSFRD